MNRGWMNHRLDEWIWLVSNPSHEVFDYFSLCVSLVHAFSSILESEMSPLHRNVAHFPFLLQRTSQLSPFRSNKSRPFPPSPLLFPTMDLGCQNICVSAQFVHVLSEFEVECGSEISIFALGSNSLCHNPSSTQSFTWIPVNEKNWKWEDETVK